MRSFRRFLANLSNGFGLFKALNPVGPVRGVVRAVWTAGILRFFAGFLLFLVRLFWSAIRWVGALNWRLLLQGAPALTVAAVLVTFSVVALFTRAEELENRYTNWAWEALQAKDYKQAIACYDRLSQLKHDQSPEITYQLALTALQDKQLGRCVLLMQQIAPLDATGYPKAHLWYADFLIQTALDQPAERSMAKSHLQKVIKADIPEKDIAHELLGRVFAAGGEWPEAERHLGLAARTRPSARLQLAAVYRAEGKDDKAREEAKTAAAYYEGVAEADLSRHYERLKWAEALVFLENYRGAQKVLEDGLYLSKEKDFYHERLANLNAVHFDFLAKKGNAFAVERMQALEVGLKHDPKNIGLLNRVLFATGIKSQAPRMPILGASVFGWLAAAQDGVQPASGIIAQQIWQQQVDEEARKLLRDMQAKNPGSASLHFAVGMVDWEEGKRNDAKTHWEQAMALAPNNAILANNLAFLLFQMDARPLERALNLANIAVNQMPNEPGFRHTRGLILAKMGEDKDALNKDALTDLNFAFAFQSPIEKMNLHRVMAGCYQRLGASESAAEHRRLADEMERPEAKKK